MSEVLVSLIEAFAPSVSSKLIDVIMEKKIKRDEIFVVLVALMAEQNNNTVKLIDGLSEQVVKLSDGMNKVLKEIKTVGEGIAVLLKRTES